MTTIYDVPADALISRLSDYIKGNIDEVQPPQWAAYAKTGSHVERAPHDPDWWYVRTASMMRKLYINGPIGISTLRKAWESDPPTSEKPGGTSSERFSSSWKEQA